MRLNNSASSGVPSLRTLSYWVPGWMRCRVRCEAFPRSARSRFADTCLHLVARRSNVLLRWKYYARNAADSPVDKFEDALESSVNRFHDHTAFDVCREIRGCVPYPDGADESASVLECVGDAVAFVVCHDGSFFDCFFMWTVVVDCG